MTYLDKLSHSCSYYVRRRSDGWGLRWPNSGAAGSEGDDVNIENVQFENAGIESGLVRARPQYVVGLGPDWNL